MFLTFATLNVRIPLMSVTLYFRNVTLPSDASQRPILQFMIVCWYNDVFCFRQLECVRFGIGCQTQSSVPIAMVEGSLERAPLIWSLSQHVDLSSSFK